jgi:hypothetical protein
MNHSCVPTPARCAFVADCQEPGGPAMAREIRTGLTIHVAAVCDRHAIDAEDLGFEERPPAS